MSLKNNRSISNERYGNIQPTGSHKPRLYGLPKIHKSGVPLRSVLDMTDSLDHAFAKWLTEILKPVYKIMTK